MRAFRWSLAALLCVAAGSVGLAQVGRGGTRWFAPLADAQRTSWVRTDSRISLETMAGPGFKLQWKAVPAGDAHPRGAFAHGVTASGVTLFVPMSVVTGAGDRVYGLDNDIGFVVWSRALDVEDAASLPACAGAITAAATRIVPLDATATADPLFRPAGPPGVGYRMLVGRPGEGAPVDNVRRQAQAAARPTPPAGAPAPSGPAAAPGAASSVVSGTTPATRPADYIPGAPRPEGPPSRSALARPSGVVYVVARDGRLRVLGLASGKDLQRPARFLPRGARWTAPIAVDTMLYAATTGACGNTTDAVYALDLDREEKPVVSWQTGGAPIAGPVAFTSEGVLLAAVGAGTVTGDGKANAIVALDPRTLAVKDWFTHPEADFVTGPSVFRVGTKEMVTAASRDGRVWVLDTASLGGPDHATAAATSRPLAARSGTAGGGIAAGALAVWQDAGKGTTHIAVPVDGALAAGVARAGTAITRGAVVALTLTETDGRLSLEPAWTSGNLAAPATPLIVNGVVFTLSPGVKAAGAAPATGAVLQAYDGVSGRRLWTSGRTMRAAASPGSLWSSLGQVYVGTDDGTLYAFGFDDERW